jgi:hypothetical protein
MFNKINDASVFYFLSLKKRTNKKSKNNCHVGRGSDEGLTLVLRIDELVCYLTMNLLNNPVHQLKKNY